MTCNGEEDAIAIQKVGDECTAVLAKGGNIEHSYIDENSPKSGIKLRFGNGEACYGNEREVEFILKCDPNIDFETERVEETDT